MSNDAAVQATITGTHSVAQSAMYGVWLKTMCDGFEDTKTLEIYAENEEDAAVRAILSECYIYNKDDDESGEVENEVRNAVRNDEIFTDPASVTDISVEYVVPLVTFDMKMVVSGQERTFKAHYPMEDGDLPEYVIRHYY